MTVNRWSTTANTNSTADSTINWRENQAPSTVNDSARAMMAAVAKWRDDISGNLVTGGTSTAYTLSTNQVFVSLTDGLYVRARLNAANGAAPTLNVDGTGAKAIASIYGTALRSSATRIGGIYGFTYDSTDDKWIIDGALDVETATGEIKAYVGTSAPNGYVRANGRTIGNAASSATERANADTATLFALLWDSYSDTVCSVSSGRGANAAADYAAGKSIGLPDLRGRSLFGLDDMGGSAAGRLAAATIDQTTNGATGGADAVTIAEANLPAHTHGAGTLEAASNGAHTHTINDLSGTEDNNNSGSTPTSALRENFVGAAYTLTAASNGAHTHTITGSTSSIGSGTAVDKLPPCFLTTWIIKL